MADLPAPLRVGSDLSDRQTSFTNTSLVTDAGAKRDVQVPSIQVLDEHGALPRKRYSYPAHTPSPGSDTLTSPLEAQLRRQREHDTIHEESTEYDPAAEHSRHPPSLKPAGAPSRGKSILDRLNSFRNTLSRQNRYAELDEDEEVLQSGRQRRMRGAEEDEAEGEAVLYDISGFGGPIPMLGMTSRKGRSKQTSTEIDLDPTTGGSGGLPRRMGTIGGGMDHILSASSGDVRRALTTKHRRTPSDIEARKTAQQQAKKMGGIVAVDEMPFDISHFEGVPGAADALQNAADDSKGDTKSYYFPPDPDLPNWRPMSMKWPYITVLVSLAILFGVLQEYLLQLSIERSHHNDGLIKFTKASDVSLSVYFAWKYLPTIVLVSYGVMWQVTDFEVKRLEPFHQLSKPSGATAAQSLNIDYLTFLQYFVPIKAIRHKQWAVLFSSIGTLTTTTLIPVLQSAAVNLYPNSSQRRANQPKFVRMDAGFSRATTVFCALVAMMGVLLIFVFERRKSGLLSDPKGIAGIAAMATRSHILNDFRNLDTASNHKINEHIRARRYILHKSALWQGEFVRDSGPAEEIKPEHPHPVMLRLVAGIPYIASLVLFLILIPIFMFVPRANVVTEKVPWLLITLATILKFFWYTMEMDVRMIQPFYVLSRRRAPPRTLTLDYTGTMPGVICVQAWLNKHYLVMVVGACSILTEILTVCVSSFSVDGSKFIPGADDSKDDPNGEDNSQETFTSFWVSLGLSTGILVIMCAVAALVYLRRRHKFLPREPGTIASVLAFIHQSRMLVDFVDTETFNSRKMTSYLEAIGKTYGLGWFNGRDAEDHCGVDEEPLLSDYKWGQDWRKGRITSMAIGSWDVY